MKGREAKRLLEKLGVVFEERTNHYLVTYLGKRTFLPRHPSREMNERTLRAVLKDLGLKRSDIRG